MIMMDPKTPQSKALQHKKDIIVLESIISKTTLQCLLSLLHSHRLICSRAVRSDSKYESESDTMIGSYRMLVFCSDLFGLNLLGIVFNFSPNTYRLTPIICSQSFHVHFVPLRQFYFFTDNNLVFGTANMKLGLLY